MMAGAGIELELHCRTCGRPFTPSHADYVKGPGHYRHCPACRADRQSTKPNDPRKEPTS